MYTWYKRKYYFYEQEMCSYICTQHFTIENGVFARTSILARSPQHFIMVAVLMLVYHVILCKFILYLKC